MYIVHFLFFYLFLVPCDSTQYIADKDVVVPTRTESMPCRYNACLVELGSSSSSVP